MAAEHSSTGLVAFGILQILVGLVCVLLVLYIASGAEITVRQGPGGGAALASSLLLFGISAVYFITVGVGSMRARRWARALSIVVSAMWLAAGLVTTLLVVSGMPNLSAIATAIVAGIVLPAAIFLFYRREPVRAICEANEGPQWTDRVPLPILAVVIVLAFGALLLVANLANPVITVFGRAITGAPAAVTLLGLAILSAWLAFEFFRLRESAWWTLIMLQAIGIALAAASMMRQDDRESATRSPFFFAVVVGSWVAYFAYLLFIRRYFALRTQPRTRREDVPAQREFI